MKQTRLLESINTELKNSRLEIGEVKITASIGSSLWTPRQPIDMDRLVQEADRAIYVKKEGMFRNDTELKG